MLLSLIEDATWQIPDWHRIEKDEPHPVKSEFWTEIGSEWMTLLAEFMGSPYQITESPNFWLISSLPSKQSIEQIKWLEGIMQRIKKFLGPLSKDELLGKCPVLMFSSDEEYYDYIANYYEDGEWAVSGGVYLNHGYGHFAIPSSSSTNLSGALAHELTHSLIANPLIPAWLNEGITQLCEEAIVGHLSIDEETVREHIDTHWNDKSIQAFWDGRGFKTPDESQTLCYHLSQLLVYHLIKDRIRFDSFAQHAVYADAGGSALEQTYGLTLHELVEPILGEGDWSFRKR